MNTAIHDQGLIKFMNIPNGWIEFNVETFDTSQLRFFHPPDSLDAKLCYFYRGLPTETAAGQKFVELLSQSPHTLTEAEIESLNATLGESANYLAFDLTAAWTDLLNERSVMIVEGNWSRTNLRSYDVFVDVDGTGRIIQEVYYLAPPALYQQFIDEVKKCLSTIIWFAD